jgi:hypothetical protein
MSSCRTGCCLGGRQGALQQGGYRGSHDHRPTGRGYAAHGPLDGRVKGCSAPPAVSGPAQFKAPGPTLLPGGTAYAPEFAGKNAAQVASPLTSSHTCTSNLKAVINPCGWRGHGKAEAQRAGAGE